MDVGDGLDIWIVSSTLNQPGTEKPVYQGTDSQSAANKGGIGRRRFATLTPLTPLDYLTT